MSKNIHKILDTSIFGLSFINCSTSEMTEKLAQKFSHLYQKREIEKIIIGHALFNSDSEKKKLRRYDASINKNLN